MGGLQNTANIVAILPACYLNRTCEQFEQNIYSKGEKHDWLKKVVRFLCLFSFKLGTFNRHANISTTEFIIRTYNYAMHYYKIGNSTIKLSCSSRRGSKDFWKGGWKDFLKKGRGEEKNWEQKYTLIYFIIKQDNISQKLKISYTCTFHVDTV